MMICAIAAMSANRVIGKDNKLPWHIPEDLKFFKTQTSNKIMILGRKTFESLGKPLPKRFHIVVTRNTDYKYDHPMVKIVSSLVEAINLAKKMLSEQELNHSMTADVSSSSSDLTVTSHNNHNVKFDSTEIIIAGGAEIYKQSLPYLARIYLTIIEQHIEGDAFFPEIDINKFRLVKKEDRTDPVKFSFCIYDKI